MNRFGWGVALAFLAVLALAVWPRGGTQPAVGTPVAAAPLANVKLVIPVQGITARQLTDTWGQSREGGARAHQAIDIMAPGGTPVLAAMAGRIEKLFVSERGGITVYVRSHDGVWLAYYAHLQGFADGLREGLTVAAGQRIGYVGDTGNAGAGNTHLHFALHRMTPSERWWQGVPVNPYPLLAGEPVAR